MSRTLLALLLVSAAVSAQAEQTPAPPPGQVTCTDPRPQMCTQVYQPVCATKRDGTRQTYSNGCMACTDRNVATHIPGPCG